MKGKRSETGGHALRVTTTRKRIHRLHRRVRRESRLPWRRFLIIWTLSALVGTPSCAAEAKPKTVAAFDRYIAATEARMDSDIRSDRFLIIDRLSEIDRQRAYDGLHQRQVYIEEVHAQENHRRILVPDGLIHDWAGVIFIPNATLAETVAVLQDYANQQNIYRPDVRRSKLIERNGNESKIYLQFFNKSIITVVLNVDFDVTETRFGSTRVQSESRSMRIAEVADAGTPEEHESPADENHGYMWRMNSYWRIEEENGGVYVQEESVELSRTIPVLLAWIVKPLTKNIPRQVLSRLLTDTRAAVIKRETRSSHAGFSYSPPQHVFARRVISSRTSGDRRFSSIAF